MRSAHGDNRRSKIESQYVNKDNERGHPVHAIRAAAHALGLLIPLAGNCMKRDRPRPFVAPRRRIGRPVGCRRHDTTKVRDSAFTFELVDRSGSLRGRMLRVRRVQSGFRNPSPGRARSWPTIRSRKRSRVRCNKDCSWFRRAAARRTLAESRWRLSVLLRNRSLPRSERF